MDEFPSVAWFQRLAERMAAQPEKYRRLGPIDMTLVPRIVFPDGHVELYALAFRGHTCASVEQPASLAAVRGPHPVVIEGDYAAWRDMIESIRRHGGADLNHTLNALTLPDWPLRLAPLDEREGQLDVDRFYRYAESLQQFFDEAAAVETRFAA
ncbi:MAG TPA: hypothetical protein VKW76_12365 [Candidatus Binatia bacterium]|nr:hypothetical protein [Candidatus Binatia bacterium]